VPPRDLKAEIVAFNKAHNAELAAQNAAKKRAAKALRGALAYYLLSWIKDRCTAPPLGGDDNCNACKQKWMRVNLSA